jgi:hypothetical protein
MKLLKNKKIRKFIEDGSFIDFMNYINNKLQTKYTEAKLLKLFNELRTELDSKLNPVGILNDDEIVSKVEERIISFVKDSSTVEVKDECKLGGGKICNQGDINSVNIRKIKE